MRAETEAKEKYQIKVKQGTADPSPLKRFGMTPKKVRGNYGKSWRGPPLQDAGAAPLTEKAGAKGWDGA